MSGKTYSSSKESNTRSGKSNSQSGKTYSFSKESNTRSGSTSSRSGKAGLTSVESDGISGSRDFRKLIDIVSNTNVTKEMDFRNAALVASSLESRSPRAQSGAPRARHRKFYRPSAAFFSGHPARRVVVRPRRTRSPGPIGNLKHLPQLKSISLQILVLEINKPHGTLPFLSLHFV